MYNNSSASEQRRKQFRTRNREELHHKLRFKEPLLRIEHNAKERECRMLIAKSFSNLGKCCSYLDNKRRTPSKFSILVAAKKECDSLKIYEKKLLVEKEYWLTANNQLKRRLKSNAMSSDNIITIDDWYNTVVTNEKIHIILGYNFKKKKNICFVAFYNSIITSVYCPRAPFYYWLCAHNSGITNKYLRQ